jgi:hypothetical protein
VHGFEVFPDRFGDGNDKVRDADCERIDRPAPRQESALDDVLGRDDNRDSREPSGDSPNLFSVKEMRMQNSDSFPPEKPDKRHEFQRRELRFDVEVMDSDSGAFEAASDFAANRAEAGDATLEPAASYASRQFVNDSFRAAGFEAGYDVHYADFVHGCNIPQ